MCHFNHHRTIEERLDLIEHLIVDYAQTLNDSNHIDEYDPQYVIRYMKQIEYTPIDIDEIVERSFKQVCSEEVFKLNLNKIKQYAFDTKNIMLSTLYSR